MSNANICTKKPVRTIDVDLEADKKYFYCTCGKSQKQPFCDGAHKQEGLFKPYAFKAKETGKKRFCIYVNHDDK